MLDPAGGNAAWDPERSHWKYLDDTERNTQYRRGELSGTLDILVEYVFDPLGMEVVYDDYTGRAIGVIDSRLDCLDETTQSSGNFTLSSLTSLLVPDGDGISGVSPDDKAILGNEWFGDCSEFTDEGSDYWSNMTWRNDDDTVESTTEYR